MKVLIYGLPGAGKTTLAKVLSKKLNAVHWNADEVRSMVNKDLGFSLADRQEQSRRMGWLCDKVTQAGHISIADFVCPTKETRKLFNPTISIFMNTIETSRFADTNKLFEIPEYGEYHFMIRNFEELTEESIDYICDTINSLYMKEN